jgi:hypothetical protein
MLSDKAQQALNEANRMAGEEGYLLAGFLMEGDELLFIFDNVPGSMSVGSFKKLLYQVRESLGAEVTVEKAALYNEVPKEEMN